MQASRKKFVVSELKAFNKGLGKRILDEKFCKMAANTFAFYRGTDHLFWADFSKDSRLSKFSSPKTKTWLQGDLHAYNFGSFEDNHGDLVYGLNDFDESVIADYQYDVWRMAVSLLLMSRENGASKKNDEKNIIETFALAYVKQLKNLIGTKDEAKIIYNAKNTRGVLKDYLKSTDKRNKVARAKMLTKWTTDGKFNLTSPKLGKVTDKERAAIISAIEGKKNELSQYRRSLRGRLVGEKQNYFHVVDVAERLLAGTGSVGTKRFYVLLAGKGDKNNDDIILDVKHQGRSSSFNYLSKEDRPYYSFDNDAHRTIEGYRALSVNPDNHLGWIKLPKLSDNVPSGYYSIRERSPEKEAYPGLVADLKDPKLSLAKKSNFLLMAEHWGEILATSHARADNDANQARIPYSFEKNVSQILKGKSKDFADMVWDVAGSYAEQVAEDFKIFTDWFDASICPAILQPRTPSETKAILTARPQEAANVDDSDKKRKSEVKKEKKKDKKKADKKDKKGKKDKKAKKKKESKEEVADLLTVKPIKKDKAAARGEKPKAKAKANAKNASPRVSSTKAKSSTAAKKASSRVTSTKAKASTATKKRAAAKKKASAAPKKKVAATKKSSAAAKKKALVAKKSAVAKKRR